MPFSIDTFIAEMNENYFLLASDFEVQITKATASSGHGTTSGASSSAQTIMLRCEATDLPGRTVITQDGSDYGIPRNVALKSAMNADSINLSIILSANMQEKAFFEGWIDQIVGSYRQGDSTGGHGAATNAPSVYDMSFYESYIGTVDIRVYSSSGELSNTVSLKEAYPVSISPLRLSWDAGNQILKLPVTMTYRWYEENYTVPSNQTNRQGIPVNGGHADIAPSTILSSKKQLTPSR